MRSQRETGGARAKRAAYRRGRAGEVIAALFLRLRGYRILAHRFKTPVGEIDLVARRGRRLAFIEVKSHKTVDAAASAVTRRQQRRVRRAAEYWLAHNDGAFEEIGFDVILLAPWQMPHHLVDAFSHISYDS